MGHERETGNSGAGRSRRDMLQVLNQSEHLVAALLEAASQAVLATDRTGKIVVANRRVEEMFGYSREELLGAQIELLLPEDRRSTHAVDRGGYFAHPRSRPMGIGMDLSARRKDGSEIPVEVSLSYVETDEGLFGIAMVSDISLRKSLEEQLTHAQKMEAVGRLAGGVAHDFNNMLTVITGYTRMILDELPALDPLRVYAAEALSAADRAAGLTNQLLTFSRRQLMRPRVINVNSVVRQSQAMLQRLIGEDVALTVNLKENLGNIRADPGHLAQAIVNLAVNSRDAMPLGGTLFIESDDVVLDENYAKSHMGVHPGDFVMISVSDTGHGMDPATRRRIFEPFFTTKEKGKGTGLGLATVYGMVKQTGGDIWVYSEPGKGTTFKLYFPRVGEPVTEFLEDDESRVERSVGETVLVVEDEQAVRDLTVRILQRLGYQTLAAASGQEALDISDSHNGEIAMLLTDVVMPMMSGKQLAEVMRERRPGIPVLFLSGYTETAVLHHGVLDEGVDFLPKPFTRDGLGKKIREVLGK
jgi:two-component system cell cycle sensor histidine kinase/response regulator CckA